MFKSIYPDAENILEPFSLITIMCKSKWKNIKARIFPKQFPYEF